MSAMEKFQSQIEKVLVPLASKLNSQRNISTNYGRIFNGIT